MSDYAQVVKWKSGTLTLQGTNDKEIRARALKYLEIHQEKFFQVSPADKVVDQIAAEMDAVKK